MSLLKTEGKRGIFISQHDYQAFIEAHKSPAPTPADLAAIAQAGKDLKDHTKTTDQRLDALIKVLGLWSPAGKPVVPMNCNPPSPRLRRVSANLPLATSAVAFTCPHSPTGKPVVLCGGG